MISDVLKSCAVGHFQYKECVETRADFVYTFVTFSIFKVYEKEAYNIQGLLNTC